MMNDFTLDTVFVTGYDTVFTYIPHVKSAQHWNKVDFWPELGLSITYLSNNGHVMNHIWLLTVLYHRLLVRNW